MTAATIESWIDIRTPMTTADSLDAWRWTCVVDALDLRCATGYTPALALRPVFVGPHNATLARRGPIHRCSNNRGVAALLCRARAAPSSGAALTIT